MGGRLRLEEIPGIVPARNQQIIGSAFAPRCGFATERCRTITPTLADFGTEHRVACWEAQRVGAAVP